jgi:hypothetical protein
MVVLPGTQDRVIRSDAPQVEQVSGSGVWHGGTAQFADDPGSDDGRFRTRFGAYRYSDSDSAA